VDKPIEVRGSVMYVKFDSVPEDVAGKLETFFKNVAAGLSVRLWGVHPVGVEVTIPPYEPEVVEPVSSLSLTGRFYHVALPTKGSKRFDLLGVLDSGKLLIVEVKNVEPAGGPSDLNLWEVAERVDALLEKARAHERYMRLLRLCLTAPCLTAADLLPRLAPLPGGYFPRGEAATRPWCSQWYWQTRAA